MSIRKDCRVSAVPIVSLLGLLVGCESHPTPATEASTVAERRVSRPRVPSEFLQSLGLETLWYNPAGEVPAGVDSATLLGGDLFISTAPTEERKGLLKVVQRSNLHTRWYTEFETREARMPQVPSKLPSIYIYPSGPAGASRPNEVLFSQLDTVYCLDLRHGDLLWKQQLRFPISTRVVADDQGFFVGSNNGRVYGLRKDSTVEQWTYRTGDEIKASPVVEGASVFVASMDGAVYKLTARSGFVNGSSWKFQTGSRLVADPMIFSRWIIVGSEDYKLYCLETQDGSRYWSFATEAPIEEAPVVYSFRPNQEFVYCVSLDSTYRVPKRTLFSVKLSDGQEQWRREGIRRVVSMGKQNLYAVNDPAQGEERSLIALDVLTGKEKFRVPLTGFHFVPTNLANYGRDQKERGRIYLVAEDGTIQVLGERL